MPVKTLKINAQLISGTDEDTILQAAQAAEIHIPTLCHLAGVTDVGACHLCLVEISGSSKLQPACVTKVAEGMEVTTHSDRLQRYRRTIIEMLSAEGNHVCSVCVANGNCELQDLAIEMGMDHMRLNYHFPQRQVDASHRRFGIDHNRCILCTRCIRVCDQIKGAHTWDMLGRGTHSHVITDLNQPWGTSPTCTSCSKCVSACPTGALFTQGVTGGEMKYNPAKLDFLVTAREQQ